MPFYIRYISMSMNITISTVGIFEGHRRAALSHKCVCGDHSLVLVQEARIEFIATLAARCQE